MPARVVVGLEPDGGAGQEDGEAVALVERAVLATLADRGVADAEISVSLLDDAGMAALNREWKGVDGPTDVLAFALQEEGESPLGDVYIGRDRARSQARELGESPATELARLAVHATLHVLGWEHPEEGRESSEMWRHQERILARIVAG
jgi:probable rRNA maturation factor